MHQHWRYDVVCNGSIFLLSLGIEPAVLNLKAAVASARKKKILMMNELCFRKKFVRKNNIFEIFKGTLFCMKISILIYHCSYYSLYLFLYSTL